VALIPLGVLLPDLLASCATDAVLPAELEPWWTGQGGRYVGFWESRRLTRREEERLFAVGVNAERVQVQVEMAAMFLIRLGAQYRFELSASPIVNGS
jgi:hypothetical protein